MDMRVRILDSKRSIGEKGDGGRIISVFLRERGKKVVFESRVR